MRIRILHFILFSCLVIGCTSKSSKNKMVDFDSMQIVKPIAETIHVNYETPVSIKYVPVVEEEKTDIYQIAEVMPEFPNGLDALFNFISDNLKYPSDALEKGMQGRVVVQVVVNEDGSVTQPQILKSISPSLDKEALRIVSIMPKWKPGIWNTSKSQIHISSSI